MEVRVDGFRSSSENWLRASLASSHELPMLNSDEQQVAKSLGIPAESYARSRYAGELTVNELEKKAEKLGSFIQEWLTAKRVFGSVDSIWLKTFEGRYRISIDLSGKHILLFTEEELVDEVFEAGSSKAERELRHVLEFNLLPAEAAKAS